MKKIFILVIVLLATLSSIEVKAQFQPTGGPWAGGVQLYDMIEWQDVWYVAANDFLVRSFDQGSSWEVVTEGIPRTDIMPRSFAFFDGHLYMSTNSEFRMLRSSDGISWQQVNTNLPSIFGVPTYTAQRMIVNNGRLIALPYGFSSIYYLNEGSTEWQESDFGGTTGNGIAHINGDTLYASISNEFKMSVDNGTTWTDFPSRPSIAVSTVGATDFLRVGNRVIVTTSAGGNNGIFYSDDNLQSWNAPSTNFPSVMIGTNRLLYLADDNILALSLEGMMQSFDQGSTWTELTTEDTRPAGFTNFIKKLSTDQIAIGSRSGLFIYDDLGTGASRGLDMGFGTIDLYQTKLFKGEIVHFINGFLSSYSLEENRWHQLLDSRDLGIDVFSNPLLYTAIYSIQDKLILLGNGTAFMSENGQNFEEMNIPNDIVPVAFHELGNRWFMVSGVQGNFNNWLGGAVYYSDNEGSDWIQASVPDFPTGSTFGPVFFSHSLVSTNNHLFLVGNGRLLRSSNGGENWDVLVTSSGPNHLLYEFDGALFLGSEEGRIQRSKDNGSTWDDWYEGLPNRYAFSRAPKGLVKVGNQLITYNDPSANVPAEEGEKGFFVLNTAEGNWTYNPDIEQLPFIPRGMIALQGRIFANWQNLGYWISPARTNTSSPNPANDLPQKFALEQNYPNPFNPATTIQFSIPESTQATIQILNAQGQTVNQIHVGQLNAGTHTVNFESGSLPSGIYFYRLLANGKVIQSKAMTLIK